MALLDDVKLALRIAPVQTQFDGEIEDLIAAAQGELIRAGVNPAKAVDHADPLVKRAIVTYCKAHFGWENADYERLDAAFWRLVEHLSLSAEYRAPDQGDAP